MFTVQQLLVRYVISGANRSIQMKAVQYTGCNKKLELVTKEIPCVSNKDIKLEVHYAGISNIDLNIIDGKFACKEDGVVPGHEFCGIVKEIGKDVTHVKVGDKVVTDPSICMVCRNCRIGLPHYCSAGGLNSYIGIYHDGGWAQYSVVPDSQVHKIPECLSFEQASLCEPMSCLSHTWDCISPIPLGTRILILGSGIIGNLFASLLHLKGHKNVTVSEPDENRLKLIEGLDLCYDLITPSCLKSRQKENPNYLFDFVFDASGNAHAMEHGLTMLDNLGKFCIFGAADPKDTMSINPFQMFRKELKIQGCVINPFSFTKSLHILEAMGDRYVSFKKLGVQVFPLDNYKEAIAALRKRTITKATFKIAEKSSC